MQDVILNNPNVLHVLRVCLVVFEIFEPVLEGAIGELMNILLLFVLISQHLGLLIHLRERR